MITLPDFTPTKQQLEAVQVACDWYFSAPHTRQAFICIGGLAGTGKTSIIPFILHKLNVNKVAHLAYTGKAADNMQRKGMNGAGTIHSHCYIPEDEEEEETEAEMERKNRNTSDHRKKKFSLKNKMCKFKKRKVIAGDPELVVIDEGSMVGKDIFNDLLSYHVPILVIGDFGQLTYQLSLNSFNCWKPLRAFRATT